MDVYEPQEDSALLNRFVEQEARGRVLDMGTGSGTQALVAAKKYGVESVLAVDVNPAAVAYAKKAVAEVPEEARSKVEVRASDFFANVKEDEVFDTIICNPPYLPSEEYDDDEALYGGLEGWEFTSRFLKEAKKHLAPRGCILLLFSSLTNKERVEQTLKEEGYYWEELGVEAHFFERLYVYKVAMKR